MEEVLVQQPVGRLAPSPTGALHLGNIRTFMVAWLQARTQGGRVILRIEDLDHPHNKPHAAQALMEDLQWLGFDWDETYVQSERRRFYAEALAVLQAASCVYPCVCTRRDVENAQAAPHAGDQLFYPGTCRGRFSDWAAACAVKADPCWRFHVADESVVRLEDLFAGAYEQDVARTLGDFPLARDARGAGYTLAVVVDDLLMGVTEVVRGDDLLPATPAQMLVAQVLLPWARQHNPSAALPRFCHVPLVVGADGKRLAKRHGDTRIATYRAAGCSPEDILGWLAASCGWCVDGDKPTLRDLCDRFTLATLPRHPFVLPERLGAAT